MKLMGLDYGSATVGTAVSDDLFLTAQAVEVIRRKHANKLRQTYQRIEQLIAQRNVDALVVGYPKHLDNSIGERAKLSEEFADALRRRTGLPVILWDERLTTVMAHRFLDAADTGWKKKREVVDQVAAAIILQSYMDYLREHEEARKELEEEIRERKGTDNSFCN